jgi:hypothetical protein
LLSDITAIRDEAYCCGINKIIRNKMKNTTYLTVRTIAKSNIKIVERIKYDTPNLC